MPRKRPAKAPAKQRPATAGGLYRLSVYLHEDELRAVEALARKERCSRADAVRRAIRAHFGIED